MVAYGFKTRFAAPILAGTKRQTIRALRTGRSRHARPGDDLQLYTGMRTRHCKKVIDTVCTAVDHISLDIMGGRVICAGVEIDTMAECNDFAREDGFADWSDLVAFWRSEHPSIEVFAGVRIRWEPPTLKMNVSPEFDAAVARKGAGWTRKR